MDHREVKDIEKKLRRLERRNLGMWALAAVLMVSLGLALVSLHTAGTTGPLVEDGTRYVLVVGLSGLIVLFSLYMLLKQHQIQGLRTELFKVALEQESLRYRLAGIASLFDGIAGIGPLELEPMLGTLAEQVRTSFDAERASLLLLDGEPAELRCVAASGTEAERIRGSRVSLGEQAGIEHCESLGKVLLEAARGFPFVPGPRPEGAPDLAVPLALPDRVIGVLSIGRAAGGASFTAEDERVVGVFAAHIAIAIRRAHDLRAAEEALRQKEELLQQAHKMESLGRMAGGVAHDYNNLLTVILSSTAKLLRGIPEGHRLRAPAEGISEAADRCAALTRQLLTFSRKQVVQMEVVDLNARVEQMCTLLRRMVGENVELITRLDPDAGRLRADPTQVEQVLMNLAVNARDAMPLGGRLTLSTSRQHLDETAAGAQLGAAAGDYVVLTVADTGQGMDDRIRAQVFEPFFTTKDQRMGLGLSLVYGVVQQSGGFIEVDSTPGRGTTFRLRFPRIEAPAERPAPPPLPVRPARRGASILLVEDEDSVRKLVREMLETQGYRVLEARWAGEAVILSQSHIGPIDLLITDVVMPGESGGELAQWMQRTRPGMPVLYISGYPNDAIVRHGVQHEGAMFLQKPFTEEALLAQVAAMLESRQDEERLELDRAA